MRRPPPPHAAAARAAALAAAGAAVPSSPRRPRPPARPTRPCSTSTRRPRRSSTTASASAPCARRRSGPTRAGPPPALVGKVAGGDLAGAGPRRIAARCAPGGASPASAASSRSTRSRRSSGRDQRRPVARRRPSSAWGRTRTGSIFYAGAGARRAGGPRRPARAPCRRRLRALVDAVSRGRATYLLTYRGDLRRCRPARWPRRPTRWLARWPAADRGELRVLLGADGGLGQAELWARVRSTPAGRELLSRGPGRLRAARRRPTAREWLAQYRAHRSAPGAVGHRRGLPGARSPAGSSSRPPGTNRVRLQLTRRGQRGRDDPAPERRASCAPSAS